VNGWLTKEGDLSILADKRAMSIPGNGMIFACHIPTTSLTMESDMILNTIPCNKKKLDIIIYLTILNIIDKMTTLSDQFDSKYALYASDFQSPRT